MEDSSVKPSAAGSANPVRVRILLKITPTYSLLWRTTPSRPETVTELPASATAKSASGMLVNSCGTVATGSTSEILFVASSKTVLTNGFI